MPDLPPGTSGSLRERFVADMTVCGFTEIPRKDCLHTVGGFAAFLERSPGTATAKDIRRFQILQSEQGMHAPTIPWQPCASSSTTRSTGRTGPAS